MASDLPFITLIIGSDTISRQRARQELVAKLHDRFSDCEENHFDSDQQTFDTFLESMMTPSLFQTTRLFFLRHASALGAADCKELSRMLEWDLPDVYCIFEADDVKKRGGTRFPKEFNEWFKKFKVSAKKQPGSFSLHDYTKPPDYKVADWLTTNVPAMLGRRISKPDAEYLVDLVGYDFDTIYSEVQKIDIFLPEGQPIDRGVIAEVLEGTRLMNSFELAQALGKRDCPRMLEIIDSLCTASFYAPSAIAAIFRHFFGLFRILAYGHENPQKMKDFLRGGGGYGAQNATALEIGIAAGLMTENQANRVFPVIIKSGIVQQATAFTHDQFKQIFKWLLEYDTGIKTGKVDSGKLGFQLLCLKIARIGKGERAA